MSVALAYAFGPLQPSDDFCYYEGRRYSPGALVTMAEDVQMSCIVFGGDPAWARDKTRMAPGP